MASSKNPVRDARDETLEDSRKRTDEANAAAIERSQNSRPTPTQAENDRAKLGNLSLDELDNKEPDGSEEEGAAPPPAKSSPPAATKAD